MTFAAEIVALVVATFLAILGAAFAHDSLFQAHMGILALTLAIFTVILMRRTSFAGAPKRVCVPFSAPFSRATIGTAMAQPVSFPSSARSKSSEKSRSFSFAIGSVGMAGSFGASAAKVEAVTRQKGARRRSFRG